MVKSLVPAPACGNPKDVQDLVPEGMTAVGTYESFDAANERALVVLSMRLSYRMIPADDCYLLCVDTCHVEAVREQLDHFEQESANWPPRAPGIEYGTRRAALGLWIYAGVLIAAFIAQTVWPFFESWGINDANAVISGHDWWRPLTALLLHADIAHLAGNIVSGICLIWLVVQIYGNRLGWLLVVLSGMAGNALCAWLYAPAAYRSLGASTAIFGALGLLVGHALAVGFNPGGWKRLRSRLVPLAAGLTVLVLTGTSGERTDILAHVAGFGCGVGIGLLSQVLPRRFRPQG